MRFFARNKCRAVILCGTLFAFGGITQNLKAQETQGQGSRSSDVAQFDAFLDAHADVDAQLRANPSLLTNAEYLEAHPQLETFLNQHPQVQTQVAQNSSFFMEREKRFDAREARRRTNPNPDLTTQQVATMDQFLDKNPNIDQDLRRNPSLVNNAAYLQAHPQLQAFLNQHPNMKEEIAENPRYFMQREQRFESHETERGASASGSATASGSTSTSGNASASGGAQERNRGQNPDLTRQQVAALDQFLDSHRDIDQTLSKNPWLIRNATYLSQHPELQTFLNQHPELKEESAETPAYLMQREKRFDAREQNRAQNPDLTRQQVAALDQFLDSHRDIDQTRSKNPWLIRNATYLNQHPELQTFLNQHPELKEESAETPAYLMQREKRFDAQESRRANPNPDLTRQEVATADQFFDKNPNIDQDLRRNPSLVNNAEYLEAHPQLQSFLNQHPNVKEEIAENPRYFMQRENRFDAQEANRRDNDRDFDRDRNRSDADRDRDATARNDRDDATARNDRDFDRDRTRDTDRDARRSNDVDRRTNPNPDLTNREVATMDDFLDRHQDVAKSLEKKPELINDHNYLKRHKDLDEFLSEHPAVREEVRENPSYFMRRENQFEARNMDRDVPDRDRDRGGDVDRDRARGDRDDRADADLNKKELRDMDHFLDKHKNIEKDLQKNPSLANDDKYLKKHKPLETFLSKNPQVGEELKENPSAFMQKQQRLQKMNNHQPVEKHKTKLEEKEQTHTATPH
jgi:hypothetical protein